MKLLKFVMFLFYKYYSKGGTHRIPYFSALCATVFLIYVHIFQILILINKVDEVLPMDKGDAQFIKYIKLAAFLLPIFFVIGYLVKERDLKVAEYDEIAIKKGQIYLVLYIIVSVLALILLMIFKIK